MESLRTLGKRVPPLVKAVRIFRRIRTKWARSIRVGRATVAVPRDMRWTVGGGEHYERNVTEMLGRLTGLLQEPIFYDVGASYGFYTLRFADESQWVYAFEPVRATFDVLCRNVQHNRVTNATVFKLGLSDEEVETPINLYSSSGTNSIVWALPAHHPTKLVGREMIRVTRLDELVEREALRPPDLIKLDIEGAELPALRGGRHLISRVQPVIVLESRYEPWFNPGYSRAELLEELFRHGYLVAGLSERYDDFALYPLEEFERELVVNIVAFPRGRRDLLEGLGAIGARVLQRL
jgi:FkbM family methyltransferase